MAFLSGACSAAGEATPPRAVYVVLVEDDDEAHAVLQDLVEVAIPGPPETDFRLPDGVQGVSFVKDADGQFGARVLMFGDATQVGLDQFVANAAAKLGSASVVTLREGSPWPDCIDEPDCAVVG